MPNFKLKPLDEKEVKELKNRLKKYKNELPKLELYGPFARIRTRLYCHKGEDKHIEIGSDYIDGKNLVTFYSTNLSMSQDSEIFSISLKKGDKYLICEGNETGKGKKQIDCLSVSDGKHLKKATPKTTSGLPNSVYAKVMDMTIDPLNRGVEADLEIYRIGQTTLNAKIITKKEFALTPIRETEFNF